MCKKNCLNCQFLCVYGYHNIQGEWNRSITEKERSEIIKNKSFYSITNLLVDSRTYLRCHHGVWDEDKLIRSINHKKPDPDTLTPKEKKDLETILDKTIINTERSTKNPRGNSCFYRKFQEGMLLPAAKELEKRETKEKTASADRKWTKRGVYGTFAIAFITFLSVTPWEKLINFFLAFQRIFTQPFA